MHPFEPLRVNLRHRPADADLLEGKSRQNRKCLAVPEPFGVLRARVLRVIKHNQPVKRLEAVPEDFVRNQG